MQNKADKLVILAEFMILIKRRKISKGQKVSLGFRKCHIKTANGTWAAASQEVKICLMDR